MPLHPVQRGELTDRLRRFFGLVGPYTAQLESQVAPVAISQDISKAPWRLDGVRFFCTRDMLPAAGLVARFTIRPVQGIVLIDQIAIYNNAGAANRFNVALGSLLGTAVDAPCPEQLPSSAPNVWNDVPVIAFADTPAAPAGGEDLYWLGLGPTSQLVLPTEIVLDADHPVQIASEVTGGSVRFSVSGLHFAQV